MLNQKKIPSIGSVGALDMVNFGEPATVPSHDSDRDLYAHNPQVTLMRTTVDENAKMGIWIAEKLNQMEDPIRFSLTEGGVSTLDASDMSFFWSPAAHQALFVALEDNFSSSNSRTIIRIPNHINDPEFASAVVASLKSIT